MTIRGENTRRAGGTLTLATFALTGLTMLWGVGCSTSPSHPVTTGGAGSSAGTSGGGAGTSGGGAGTTVGGAGTSAGGAGTTVGGAGTSAGGAGTSAGGAGTTGGGAGTTTSNPDAAAGGSGTPGDASADGLISPPFDAAGRTQPTCTTPKPSPNGGRASECDFLLQSIDFEDQYSYPSTAASVKRTSFGTAMGLFEINNCSPYCYGKALTVGVDIVGGGDVTATQGEIVIELPATGSGLPIDTAVGRDSLAWIMLDGPTKPPFTIMGQLVLETSNGILAAKPQQLAYANWLDYQHAEFKYFEVKADTFPAAPTKVTGIGFRITSPANLPKGMEWHGVAYIDHLQVRTGTAPANPPGGYPYGL